MQKLKHIVFFISLFLAVKANAFTVVIDAGHGGHDPGALGAIVQEKNLNLDVAKRLGKMIQDNYDDVNVYLTRSTDVFLTLQARADFVNKHNADLFICIHTNAAENRNITGAETFTLGIDKMESNLDVAVRENSVMLLEDDYKTTYQGFDPNSVESYIMFELMQDMYIDKSLQFASYVQNQFSETLHRADRGVRQAGFWVLHKSACPSVLIEMGFISNRDEEKYLASENGKAEITKAIYDAFVTYRGGKAKTASSSQKADIAKSTPQTETIAKPITTSSVKVENNVEAKQDTATTKKAEVKNETDKTETKTEKTAETAKSANTQVASKPVYRVQIFSTTSVLKAGDPTFKGLKNCIYKKDGKYYKYMYGEETNYQKICAIRDQVKPKFKDCFIVAFLDGKQILVKDALKM